MIRHSGKRIIRPASRNGKQKFARVLDSLGPCYGLRRSTHHETLNLWFFAVPIRGGLVSVGKRQHVGVVERQGGNLQPDGQSRR